MLGHRLQLPGGSKVHLQNQKNEGCCRADHRISCHDPIGNQLFKRRCIVRLGLQVWEGSSIHGNGGGRPSQLPGGGLATGDEVPNGEGGGPDGGEVPQGEGVPEADTRRRSKRTRVTNKRLKVVPHVMPFVPLISGYVQHPTMT